MSYLPSAVKEMPGGSGATAPTRRLGSGDDSGFKSRGMHADEPTQRAGPCLGDVAEFLADLDSELHGIALVYEYNYYIISFEGRGGTRLELLLYVGADCMEVRGVSVRGCGRDGQAIVAELAKKPEFTVVDIEGDCIVARAPAEPPFRVVRALQLAGLTRHSRLLDIEPVEDLVGVEEQWFSINGDPHASG